MKYKLTIAYDGTAYCGWQVQGNGISIQSLIQKALETVLRHPIDLTGSGRTDAGVHARGQVAHFETEPCEQGRLLYSLNSLLPPDIRILSVEEVDPTFHARYSAKKKTYHYHLHLGAVADPFQARYRAQIFEKIDLPLLKATTSLFTGERDFTTFASVSDRKGDAIRTLYRFDAIDEPNGLRLELCANGFLYKMVRNLVGTLIDIAKHKISPEEIPALFAAKDRTKAGPSAPAHGLFLVKVDY